MQATATSTPLDDRAHYALTDPGYATRTESASCIRSVAAYPDLDLDDGRPQPIELFDDASNHHFSKTPERSLSNVRRKRASPFPLRTAPTPGHSVQMRGLFQNAQSALQNDLDFHSSSARSGSMMPSMIRGQPWQPQPVPSGVVMNQTPSQQVIGPTQQEIPSLEAFSPIHLPPPARPHPASEVNKASDVAMAEPTSSGFTSPVVASNDQTMEVSPTLVHKDSSSSSGPGDNMTSSDDENIELESYGVPLPGPMTETELEEPLAATSLSQVDAWLESVLQQSPGTSGRLRQPLQPLRSQVFREAHHNQKLGPSADLSDSKRFSAMDFRSQSRASSNKENLHPPSPASNEGSYDLPPIPQHDNLLSRSAIRAPLVTSTGSPLPQSAARYASFDHQTDISTPVLLRQPPSTFRSAGEPTTSPNPLLPRRPSEYLSLPPVSATSPLRSRPHGHFSLPPRRKKKRVAQLDGPTRENDYPGQEFEIAEDEEMDLCVDMNSSPGCMGIKGLSPNVTPFRKGKGPKRNRCASYYDQDLLADLSPTTQNRSMGRFGKGKETLHERSLSADMVGQTSMGRVEEESEVMH